MEKAVKVSEKLGEVYMARYLDFLGDAQRNNAEFEKAVQSHTHALEIRERQQVLD